MWRRVHPMTLYANGLRARHHISAKNTFRTRLSSWWLVSKGDQPTHPGLVFRFEHWRAPVTRAADRLRSAEEGLHTCVALHRFESRGHSRRVFPSFCCSLSPPSCLPWLHGHYPASALLRRLCHLPGAVLRALRAAMNAAPSPDRDP